MRNRHVHRTTIQLVLFFLVVGWLTSTTEVYGQPTPEEIVKKCIERHGGWDKFNEVRDIYAKMDVKSYSEKGDLESIVHQYFRLPDKLRAEIHPLLDPPTTISWDGTDAWQLVKEEQEKTDEKQIQRLQESLRFLKLMVLTNLFEQGSQLTYVTKLQPKSKDESKPSFGIHVISQANDKGENIKLYISDANYTLLGGESYWEGSLFKIFFDSHSWNEGLYLPTSIKLYRGKDLVVAAKLTLAKINALENGNSFFSDLKTKPKLQKSSVRNNRGRGSDD